MINLQHSPFPLPWYTSCVHHTTFLLTWFETKPFPVISGTKSWSVCLVSGTKCVLPHLIFTQPEHNPCFLLGLFVWDIRLHKLHVQTKRLQWAVHSCLTLSPGSSSKLTACLLFPHTVSATATASGLTQRAWACSCCPAQPKQLGGISVKERMSSFVPYTWTSIYRCPHSDISRQGEPASQRLPKTPLHTPREKKKNISLPK